MSNNYGFRIESTTYSGETCLVSFLDLSTNETILLGEETIPFDYFPVDGTPQGKVFIYFSGTDQTFVVDITQPNPSPTPTPTVTSTPTQTVTPTITATPTITPTTSVTPTNTPTITPTLTVTPTTSVTPSETPTQTPTVTPTTSVTATITPTVTPSITPSPTSGTPVTSDLVLYFDPSNLSSYSGTGTTINDLSGNELDGTMSNISFTDPYFSYNGSSSEISVPDNALLEPGSGNWTTEAWFYPTSFSSSSVILGKFDNGGNAQNVSYSIRVNTSGSLFAQYSNGAPATFVNSTGYTLTTNTWYQAVYVWTNSGGTKTLETFINGVSIGSVNHSFNSILNSTNPLYLGSYNGGEYSQWFNGRIGVVRIYDSALTSSEVLQNYNADKTKYIPPTPTPTPTPTITPNLDGFDYPNFSSISGLELVGTYATEASNEIVLTSPTVPSVGNVYRSTSIRYDRDFSLEWSSYVGGGTGADGYCIQWTTTNNTNGVGGGGVGRIADSSTINAIGFYTYTNNNFQWYKNNVQQSVDSVSSDYWRQVLYFWADYDHTNQTFDLYFNTSNTKPISPNKQYTSFSFDSTSYYLGFGAATGGAQDYHNILSWSLTFT